MNDTKKFTYDMIKCAPLIAVAMWVVSLIFLGLDKKFTFGILVGTMATMGNFLLLAFILRNALSMASQRASAYVSIFFVLRLFIYGIVFWVSLQVGIQAGIACICGFMTVKIPIYITSFTDKNKMKNELGKEVK